MIDLDHAADAVRVYDEKSAARRERTSTVSPLAADSHRTKIPQGTPMFIATEVSERTYGVALKGSILEIRHLIERFTAAEEHSVEFQRSGAGSTFMENMQTVLRLERARMETSFARTNTTEPHRLHHDAQSIYWSLLWAAARARPRPLNAPPVDADGEARDEDLFTSFCNTMLDHTTGNEAGRHIYIHGDSRNLGAALHESLQSLVPLLDDMAAYLTIPWHIYIGAIQPDHAHHAFRRLILLHILRNGENVPLDTSGPRKFPPQEPEGRDREETG